MDTRKIKTRRFPKEFREVSKYIKAHKGIRVVLGESTKYLGPFTREIVIHHNYDLRHNGLYILLFECGKSLLPHIEDTHIDKKTHPREWNQFHYKRDYDAWNTALKIHDTLELNLNISELLEFRNNYLLKYFSDKT